MNQIILFGLSADMPHTGHIEWVTFLRNKFPKHNLVLMPCSANPLGKKDANDNTIYPTNGYIRWKMLNDYYQKHDLEVIVSQYEVAINTPSKTATTIDYLIHTPIQKIREQRGYVRPTIYKKVQNSVSIVIGSELVFELEYWHNWQHILNVANLIIISRAGYPNLVLNNIKNLSLKTTLEHGIANQTITQYNGPQINTSSRKLKAMIQNKATDKELVKFIPTDILNYIKQNKSELSASYYQTQQAIEIFNLAMQTYTETLAEFNNRRQDKFSAFIADFVNINNINKWDSEGYKLTDGRLEVDIHRVNHESIDKELRRWMQECQCHWYETNKPSGKIIPPQEFHANFKVLGKYGPNCAVDIVLFIENTNDNSLQILSIERDDDIKTSAIPGGFCEGEPLDSLVNELLEECFSNNLFTPTSLTSKKVNQCYSNTKQIQKIVVEIITRNLENTKNPTEVIKSIAESEHLTPAELVTSSLQKVTEYLSKIKYTYTNKLLTAIRCQYYKQLLPKQFTQLHNFIKENGKFSPQQTCPTDNRNTNYAWMTTKVMRILINVRDWQKLLTDCGLEVCGGDDAYCAKIMNIADFCSHQNSAFALHKYIALKELAKYIEDKKLKLSTSILKRLVVGN